MTQNREKLFSDLKPEFDTEFRIFDLISPESPAHPPNTNHTSQTQNLQKQRQEGEELTEEELEETLKPLQAPIQTRFDIFANLIENQKQIKSATAFNELLALRATFLKTYKRIVRFRKMPPDVDYKLKFDQEVFEDRLKWVNKRLSYAEQSFTQCLDSDLGEDEDTVSAVCERGYVKKIKLFNQRVEQEFKDKLFLY